MRQDALLRSGKGLETRLETPSPTRKTSLTGKKGPVAVVAPVPAEERDDHFAVRNGVPCAGVHLIVDLHGAEGLNDIDLIDATLRRCVAAARATLLHIHLHHFHPNGVSGVAVLAESHISIHTWPDIGYARGLQGPARGRERIAARARDLKAGVPDEPGIPLFLEML
jgi:S-adenosylmethionine decarboxylase